VREGHPPPGGVPSEARVVFVTGGTGYLGRPTVETLVRGGHVVHALARRGSEPKVPHGALVVTGDALDGASYAHSVPRGATFVHLVGTPHPNPSKAAEFLSVDLASARAATTAAATAGARHFVYVSVAHPAPVMRAYVEARQRGEALVEALGIPATVLRPWYVLGPGHRWPYALVPIYAVLRRLPATRAGAERLGLVTRAQMVGALVAAVEHPPPSGVRVVDVPGIRQATREAA
jgi:uncharacterized protein YbjT (DUF2867 family)